MDLLQTLKIALRALRTNKMRSFLTMLGIIIGIAAVIAMLAVGSGASYIISQQIASIGSNIILILPGSTTSGGLRSGTGGAQTLTSDDVRAVVLSGAGKVFCAPGNAGTALDASGGLVTAGGRVLNVVATAPTLPEAVAAAYRGVDAVGFPNAHLRRDIGGRLGE